jgi:hypothetical protein
LGAVWFEPWLFSSNADDADPLFPIDFGVLHQMKDVDEVSTLSRIMLQVAYQMTEGREYLIEGASSGMFVALPRHHQAPAIRGVAKLRVEPDSPGRRIAHGRRMSMIEDRTAAYERLYKDLAGGRYDRPLGAAA